MTTHPRYLAIEGADGAPKQALLDHIVVALRGTEPRGVIATEQPSRGAIGMLIRAMLVDGEGHRHHPRALQMLFSADRIEACREVISPALQEGLTVVTSRCEMSTAAYFAGRRALFLCHDCHVELDEVGTHAEHDGEPLGAEAVTEALAWNADVPHPGLVVVLDVPADVAERRLKRHGSVVDAFASPQVQARVAQLYRGEAAEAMRRLGAEVAVVDGTGSAGDVQRRVLVVVHGYLAKVGGRERGGG